MVSHPASPNYSRKISVSLLQEIFQDAVHGYLHVLHEYYCAQVTCAGNVCKWRCGRPIYKTHK